MSDVNVPRTNTETELAQRLSLLETRCRRQRLLNVVLIGALGAATMLGATAVFEDAKFESITCRRLVMVDGDGKDRIELLTTENGTAGIRLMESTGAVRLSAATGPAGIASIDWFDGAGNARMTALAASNGATGVLVRDSNLASRVEMSVDENNVPTLSQLAPPPLDPETVPLEKLRVDLEGLKAAIDADEEAYMTKVKYLNQVAGQAGAQGLEYKGDFPQRNLQLRERYRILNEIYRRRAAAERSGEGAEPKPDDR